MSPTVVALALQPETGIQPVACPLGRRGRTAQEVVKALCAPHEQRAGEAAVVHALDQTYRERGLTSPGATAHEVTATWLSLLMRDVAAVVEAELVAIVDGLVDRGYANLWADADAGALAEHAAAVVSQLDLLWESASRREVVALGPRHRGVERAVADRLGLRPTAVPWLTTADRVAELGAVLGQACGTLAAISRAMPSTTLDLDELDRRARATVRALQTGRELDTSAAHNLFEITAASAAAVRLALADA